MAWNYCTVFADKKDDLVNARDNDFKAALTNAHSVLVYELKLLGAQKCAVCSGFGHKAENCPTGGKLLGLSRGGNCNGVLIGCLKKVIAGEAVGPDKFVH